MSFKIKLRKTDAEFSKYIRERADWKCEYCGKSYEDNHQGLHCSHYWGRGREATRFEPDNCMALCYGHHQWLGHGDGREEYRSLMIRKLGQKRFDTLMLQANTTKKRDDKLDMLYIKELQKELGLPKKEVEHEF